MPKTDYLCCENEYNKLNYTQLNIDNEEQNHSGTLQVIFLLFFLFIYFFSFAETRTIQGIITDFDSKEALAGATLYVVETKDGSIADKNGHYSIALPEGTYTLQFSYVGYKNKELKITSNASLIQNIQLTSNGLLQEVVVSTQKKNNNITNLTMGMEKLSIKEIRLLPAIMGEVDILKALQLLPGIQSTSEISTGFSVRGGSPDQNLIVLDNTTVYNPSHQMGFFSAFNNDVISGIELYKGHFPFRHGGRLSSLLEVKTRNEIPSRMNVTGGLGLISSRLMLEGPLGKKTSWLVAGRRTYADLFLVFASNKDLRNATLYFYDLNGKLIHRFSENDKLELNVYNGLDNMGMTIGSFNYGNTAASLTWNHVFTESFFGKFSAHFTDYNYALGSNLNNMDVSWKSAITDRMLRADFHQPLHSLWDLSYGFSVIYHLFNPGEIQMKGLNLDDYIIPKSEAVESGFYLSNEQMFTKKLAIKYGLRFSVFQNIGSVKHTYTGWEPGLGIVFQLTDHSSVKANYSHNTQYMQLANNSASGSPLDVWFSAGPAIQPQKVDLYSAGYFHNFKDNRYEAAIELYYKDLKNVIDFKEHSDLLMNKNLENEIQTGVGKAYGIEMMLKKNSGRLTGFVNYTLSRSERTIPEVNQGKTYLSPFDKTHAVNIVATYNFSKKINVSAIWVFTTGTPTTYPTGRFAIGDEYFPIYSGRNEYRKPNYNRLDVSLNYIPKPDSKKRWRGEWNFSIYNAYNRKNPWTILYRQNETTGIPYSEMMYLFGIVPSVTYNFKF
ncbi:MAG: TonB-dependent receptor [Dysgonamonadaceae bacterium]|nr:TonB-dependent receptor [Dysgonamonadaceae bacterium]